jgi:hypothetical protein
MLPSKLNSKRQRQNPAPLVLISCYFAGIGTAMIVANMVATTLSAPPLRAKRLYGL